MYLLFLNVEVGVTQLLDADGSATMAIHVLLMPKPPSSQAVLFRDLKPSTDIPHNSKPTRIETLQGMLRMVLYKICPKDRTNSKRKGNFTFIANEYTSSCDQLLSFVQYNFDES